MLAVQLKGKLGNQLFQIAFIRFAAKSLNERYLIIDEKAYGNQVEDYFILKWKERRVFRKLIIKLGIFNIEEELEFDNWQNPEYVVNNLKKDVIYKGFFQTPFY